MLRTKTTERGTVAIKRPGKMRWVYTKPERKEFVSDGTRLYSYLAADKQVIVSPAPGPNDGTIPALFLAGQGDIVRDFTASVHGPARRGAGADYPQADAQEGRPRLRVAGRSESTRQRCRSGTWWPPIGRAAGRRSPSAI